MNKKRTNKEISNPNLQKTLLQTASTTGTLGTRHNVIAPNMLIQAANIRMFRAMVSGKSQAWFVFMLTFI